MEKKVYKLGILVGRFQTFHKGHQDVIDKALRLCETVGVFIGSSQESGTNKNPFSYEMRRKMLEKIYGDAVRIYPLPDIGVGNNCKWGEYVLDQVRERFGRYPDLLVSGKEERRINWFDGAKGLSPAELYIPKTVDISAAEMRELFVKDDFETWKQYCDERLWSDFPMMREIVLRAYENEKTASM